MKKHFKWIIAAALGLLVVSFSVLSALRPLAVTAAEIAPREISDAVREEGTIRPGTGTEMYPPGNVKVLSVFVKEGDAVKAGDRLAAFDTKQNDEQLAAYLETLSSQRQVLEEKLSGVNAQAGQYSPGVFSKATEGDRAQIEAMVSSLGNARRDFENTQALYDLGDVSKSALDQARAALLSQESALAQLRSALSYKEEQNDATYRYYTSEAQALSLQIREIDKILSGEAQDVQSAQLAYLQRQSVLTADRDGKVGGVFIEEGKMAFPDQSAMTIYQEGSYLLEVYLLAKDAYEISPGMPALILVDKIDRTENLSGTVEAVADVAQEKVSALGLLESRIKVTVRIEGEAGLKINSKADAEIILRKEENALAVPKTALFDLDGKSHVFLVKNGRAVLYPVEKDFETETDAVLKSGVSAGDLVIVNPNQKGLAENVRVKANVK